MRSSLSLFNRILSLIVLLALCGTSAAKVEADKTYRIASVAVNGKSLFVENSSLDYHTTGKSAQIMLWSETDVASQQWTISGQEESLLITNLYTGRTMAAAANEAGAALRQSRSGALRWVLVPVDEEAGIYKIKNNSKDLFLTAIGTDDGSVPQLAEASDDTKQLWQFVEVQPKNTFTREMREEMMDDYIKKTVETVGSDRKTFIKGGWGEAEQLEVVLDAYETTGREDYLQLAEDVYAYFKANVGSSWNRLLYNDTYHWFGHDFNDDVMWQIMAVARLGLLSGNTSYVTAAKRNFDVIYKRAYIPFTGLLRWAQSSGDPYGTNSCVNGPAEVAACYLGFAGCGEEYFEMARDLYAAQRYVLANDMSTGKVWDSVVWDPATETVKSKNEWGSTYNQGTMLGAASMLYKYYGDEQYMKDAKKIIKWTKDNLCDSHGIINACQVKDGDLAGFKGILMRYVRRFIRDCDAAPADQTWMEKNALHVYCNRSVDGVTPTAWLQKGTRDNTTDDFAVSTAASAAVNTIFPDDPPLPYEEKAREDDPTPVPEPDPIAVNPAADMAWSGVYVGGHIRRERPATITKLKESGFTYVLLFNVHVNPDGTLLTDGETICENGEYVFDRTQPNYIEDILALKDDNSAIHRIEIVIGGWGNDSYNNIKGILNANNGSLSQTALYRNFRALKEALPIIDGVNNDDEQCYDVSTAVRFHAMMYDLGYRTSIAPYMNKSFWQSLVNQLNEQKPGACDRVLIQCYDGGAGNNPADWHFGDIPLLAGRTNYQTDMATSINQMQTWRDNAHVVGGFVWVYNDETWSLKDWAKGMNRLFATPPTGENGALPDAVTLCDDTGYGGYGITLPEGRYTAGELAGYGIPLLNATYNYHTIKSIKLAPGYQVTLYREDDFSGTSVTLTESSDIPSSWRSRICTIVVEPLPDGIGDFSDNQSIDEPAEIYDLAGRRVVNPVRSGTYIVRKGGKSRVVKR